MMKKTGLMMVLFCLAFGQVMATPSFSISPEGQIHYSVVNGDSQLLQYDFKITNNLARPLFLLSNELTNSGQALRLLPMENGCLFGIEGVPVSIPAHGVCYLRYIGSPPILQEHEYTTGKDFLSRLTVEDAIGTVQTVDGLGVFVAPQIGRLEWVQDGVVQNQLSLKPGDKGSLELRNTSDAPISGISRSIPTSLVDVLPWTCPETLAGHASCQINYDLSDQQAAVATTTLRVTAAGQSRALELPVTISQLGHFEFRYDGQPVSALTLTDDTSGEVILHNTGGTEITNVSFVLPANSYFTGSCNSIPVNGNCVFHFQIPATPVTGQTQLTLRGDNSDNASIELNIQTMNQWESARGPDGGTVTALLVRGDTVFAGTEKGGIYRSTDKGQSWTEVNNGLGNDGVIGQINSIIEQNGHLLINIIYEGVWRSDDNGASWQSSGSSTIAGSFPYTLANSSTTSYLGTIIGGGVFKSTDSGATWYLANTGIENESIQSLAADNDYVYAVNISGELLKSANQGAKWDMIAIPASAYTVAMHGANVYVGTVNGVYKSGDAGVSWERVGSENADFYVDLMLVNNGTVYAGRLNENLFKLTEGSTAWLPVSNASVAAKALTIAANDENVYVGGADNGVYKSTDNSNEWNSAISGLSNTTVQAFASEGENLYAGTDDGSLFTLASRTGQWSKLSDFSASITAILATTSTQLVGTSSGSIYRATGGGAWEEVASGLTEVTAFASVGNVFYAATDGASIFKSNDNGVTWISDRIDLHNGAVTALVTKGTTLYAAVSGKGVYKLSQGATAWVAANQGLDGLNINTLTAIGSDLFVGTQNAGVLMSSDDGANWNLVNHGLDDVQIHSLAGYGQHLFAATTSGVYVAEVASSSITWQPFNDALPSKKPNLLTIVNDEDVSKLTLYAAIPEHGVYKDAM